MVVYVVRCVYYSGGSRFSAMCVVCTSGGSRFSAMCVVCTSGGSRFSAMCVLVVVVGLVQCVY